MGVRRSVLLLLLLLLVVVVQVEPRAGADTGGAGAGAGGAGGLALPHLHAKPDGSSEGGSRDAPGRRQHGSGIRVLLGPDRAVRRTGVQHLAGGLATLSDSITHSLTRQSPLLGLSLLIPPLSIYVHIYTKDLVYIYTYRYKTKIPQTHKF